MAEPCTILSLVATPTACVDGYYSLDVTVTFSNPPGMINGDGTTGTLIDRKSTRLKSSHRFISYAVLCLK